MIPSRFRLATASACLALATIMPGRAAMVRFTAAIDAAQETSASTSTATGTAVLWYDATANTFSLTVTINDFSNTISASHIHEAEAGASGGVVTGIGDESVYVRSGNTITGSFSNVSYGGAPEELLLGNAYLNFHSAEFPGGEVRGQLIPDPVKLTAIIDGSQSVPARDTDAFGAAQAIYYPATNKIDLLISLYNFTNTLTASHIHEGAVGVSGGVATGLGPESAYERSGNCIMQSFVGLDHGGSPVALLSEGTYLNFHSDVFGAGEIRGQLVQATTTDAGRLANVSARGRVGTGEDVLITGLIVTGSSPVRVLADARGPGLADFGVAGALTDPVLNIYDSAGNLLVSNDAAADAPVASLIGESSLAPDQPAEPAAVLVLPPGAYTAVVSGAGSTTGVALAEAYELTW